MVIALRDKAGRFRGSIGLGKNKIPTSSVVPIFANCRAKIVPLDPAAQLLTQKVVTPKCRNRKHSWNGCPNENCPEGFSSQKFIETVTNSPELLAELEADGVTDPDYENVSFYGKNNAHWHTWSIRDKVNGNSSFFLLPQNRPELERMVDQVDKTIVPSFKTMNDLSNFVNDLYGRENVTFRIVNRSKTDDSKTQHYMLSDLYVAADLRGKGVGSHLLKMVTKHADETGAVIGLVPAESGSGNIFVTNRTEEKHEAERRKYHFELKQLYARHGFESNPGYASTGIDLLTGERFPINFDFINKLNQESYQALEYSLMVRFPNGKIPKTMFGKREKGRRK